MDFSKDKLYEQWQLIKLNGILSSPHLILIYPIYTVQLKSICSPFANKDFVKNDQENNSSELPSPNLEKNLNCYFKSLGTLYNSLKWVYNEEGYWGLYKGYVPMTIHSHLTCFIHNRLSRIHKKHIRENPKSYLKMIIFRNCSRYVAEMITYPVLTISTQQAIFNVKRYNLNLDDEQKPIDDSVVGMFSLLQLSINSDEGFVSLWNGFAAHILFRIAEDLVNYSLCSLLITKSRYTNHSDDRTPKLDFRSNYKKQLRISIRNFANSIFSPLNLISTIKRCQANNHKGLCKSDVGIREILTNVNWSIYFGQIIVNSIAIVIYLFENENSLIPNH